MNFKAVSLEQLAAIVSDKLRKHGIDSVLVGGGCVTIYSENRYQSYDLDYITYEDMKKVQKALGELGFEKKGRQFKHKECKYYIEFLTPPVAIGNEPVLEYEYRKTPLGMIKMLNPTDSVKDRLASYYYWNDEQGLDQALSICREIRSKIDLRQIKKWSQEEGYLEKFQTFLDSLDKL
jgi:hypothetical protein